MNYQNIANLLVQVILIVGALNWGLVAYNETDAVQMVAGKGDAEKYIKFAVAAAGLYHAYYMYTHFKL